MQPVSAMLNWSFSFDARGQLRAGLFISLVSVWLLVGVFSYLNYYTRRKYFSIWTVAWMFYSLYLTLCYSLFWYYGNFRDEPWWGTMFKQWCIGVAAVFMLWGTLRFLGKRIRQISLSLFLSFLFVWSLVANLPGSGEASLDKKDRLVLQIPIFVLIGAASVITVWGFFQYRRKRQYLGAGLLSFGFLFWGAFVAAYPFLEQLSDYMSTGFFMASVLQMFIAVNMIILVLEQVRHVREKRIAQQLRRQDREKALLQNRITLTEERYRHLFEQSSEPIVITTRDELRIVELNEAACRLLAMSQPEARDQSFMNLLAPDISPSDGVPAGQACFELLCRRRFQQVRRKDGSLVEVELAASAIDFAGTTAFQFYLRELTESSRLELQLRRAEKLSALGQMITGLIHELNNPLSVAGAMLELVLLDKNLPEPLAGRLRTAAAEHGRAARMVRNFLNLAREGGSEKLPMNLNEVVRQVLELQRSEVAKASVQLTQRLDPELPATAGSFDHIQQVLIILINNAIQAMENCPHPKILRVSTRQEHGRVAVLVEDSGPGVPPHLRCRIFEPFFSTKPAGVGTGLGLSIAYSYLVDHRGRIYCDQSSLGGALFGIQLPMQAQPVCRPAAQITRIKLTDEQDEEWSAPVRRGSRSAEAFRLS